MSKPAKGRDEGTSTSQSEPLDQGENSPSKEEEKREKDLAKQQILTAVPAPPPMQRDSAVQVALGMQLMMQRSSFDSLTEPIQQEMIRLAGTLDERGYEYSCKLLEERSATRRWATIAVCGFAVILLGAGAFFANKLINADKFEQALTIIMTGIGVVGALLGGAGLQSVFKNLGGR